MGRKKKDNYVHSLQNDIDLLYTVCQEETSIDETVEKFLYTKKVIRIIQTIIAG